MCPLSMIPRLNPPLPTLDRDTTSRGRERNKKRRKKKEEKDSLASTFRLFVGYDREEVESEP